MEGDQNKGTGSLGGDHGDLAGNNSATQTLLTDDKCVSGIEVTETGKTQDRLCVLNLAGKSSEKQTEQELTNKLEDQQKISSFQAVDPEASMSGQHMPHSRIDDIRVVDDTSLSNTDSIQALVQDCSVTKEETEKQSVSLDVSEKSEITDVHVSCQSLSENDSQCEEMPSEGSIAVSQPSSVASNSIPSTEVICVAEAKSSTATPAESCNVGDNSTIESNSVTLILKRKHSGDEDEVVMPVKQAKVLTDPSETEPCKPDCQIDAIVNPVLEPMATCEPSMHEKYPSEVAGSTGEFNLSIPSYENLWNKPPRQITGCWKEFESVNGDNFLKGCKWSPDGTCLLTNSNDNCLRLFNLPEELYNNQIEGLKPMESVLRMKEAEQIYDYCWYPLMSSALPDTCCLASTSREAPVHMWDAFTGHLRCSYRAYDHMDELTAAYSLTFNSDGSKLYCGFNKMIRIYDVARPGRQCESRPTYVKQGQTGIISCLSISPASPHVYAAGSYARSIALYTEPHGKMMCMFQGQQGGVTHLKFSPDGNRLYSGGRKDPEILCWDIRNPGNILFTLFRKVETNQRIYFDIDSDGRYVMSGNQDGTISVWDTTASPSVSETGDPVLAPVLDFTAHTDVVNGISLHPTMPILATASGQRHFILPDEAQSDSEDGENSQPVDFSLRLWSTG